MGGPRIDQNWRTAIDASPRRSPPAPRPSPDFEGGGLSRVLLLLGQMAAMAARASVAMIRFLFGFLRMFR